MDEHTEKLPVTITSLRDLALGRLHEKAKELRKIAKELLALASK